MVQYYNYLKIKNLCENNWSILNVKIITLALDIQEEPANHQQIELGMKKITNGLLIFNNYLLICFQILTLLKSVQFVWMKECL